MGAHWGTGGPGWPPFCAKAKFPVNNITKIKIAIVKTEFFIVLLHDKMFPAQGLGLAVKLVFYSSFYKLPLN
jgi:hypothetical protein